VDWNLDELNELKGDLPRIVAALEHDLAQREQARKDLEALIKQNTMARDQTDLGIVTQKELIEKYKTQQFQVKTNKQYDTLTREIEHAQAKITQLDKEMETLEGKTVVAKHDLEATIPQIEELRRDLSERESELDQVHREHESEELKLRHEREKLVVRISKQDMHAYERIRKAKNGKAIVAVHRGACGGCYKRVPPQTVHEIRKHARLLTCEHCGRILVSDEIVESSRSSS
jgi:predicted  nucleic acid-binding Zn-ribbon protein